MALKCSDLGHLASSHSVHRKWVLLLEEEMFRQGDLEKARGYPISPLMDREKGGITKSQPGVREGTCKRRDHKEPARGEGKDMLREDHGIIQIKSERTGVYYSCS